MEGQNTSGSTEASRDALPLTGVPQRLYSASPSRLLTWLDCPLRYRMAYLDRPKPAPRAQRAHTSIGIATHNALRDFWDVPVPERTPQRVERLVADAWSVAGFRDPEQALRWKKRVTRQVLAYLKGIDRETQPLGTERTVGFRTASLALSGRVDRLDEDGEGVVVVDYKTGRRPPTDDDARTSLPLALYAHATQQMFRRPCVRVELHHVPTGARAVHEPDPAQLARKLAEAESIARDLRAADAAYADRGPDPAVFPARPSALCPWCDVRAHCPQGQLAGAEKSDWEGLDGEDD